MKMKNIFLTFLSVCTAALVLSCNEQVKFDSFTQQAPVLTSFYPAQGPVGTEITVTGENLQSITAATINGGAAVMVSRISDTEVVIRATAAGSTGVISLASAQGTTVSDDSFTYTYPIPAVTAYPAKFPVGEMAVLNGTFLHAITGVSFTTTDGTVSATIVSQSPTELVLTVPDLQKATADITFSYSNGTSTSTFQKTGAVIQRNLPVIVSYTPTTGIKIGDEVTISGTSLHLVDSILVGGIKMPITSKPENGLTLKFKVIDNFATFADGNNTKTAIAYAFSSREEFEVNAAFPFFVPNFYKWVNVGLNAHSTVNLNHLFCLDTGMTYDAKAFNTQVDPLSKAMNGLVCVGKNKLDAAVTNDQYYAVKPYIYMAYLGSGMYFYGPANNNNRLTNFNNYATGADAIAANSYGTPIIVYRTLSASIPAEQTIINKIVAGTFASADFSFSMLSDIDLTTDGNTTADTWSNIPNGEFGAFKANTAGVSTTKTDHRPWAPTLTTATQTIDADMSTVILVLYFKPNTANWSNALAANTTNLRKFGFLHVKHLKQDASVESGRRNTATFDAYWQRTPRP